MRFERLLCEYSSLWSQGECANLPRESFRAQFWRGSGNRTTLYLLELTFGDMHVAGHFAARKWRVLKPRNIVPSRLATRHAVHMSIHCAIVAGVCAERLRWS